MTSRRQKVWLITGASSLLGYRLCLSALALGDFVIGCAASLNDVHRLRTAGAYGLKMESELNFGEIKRRIREAASFYGRIDIVVNNPGYDPTGGLNAYDLSDAYDINTFSYTAIQVTKAVAQEWVISQIVVIALQTQPGHSQLASYSSNVSDHVEATAQLFAAEYRSQGVRVLLVKPRSLCAASGSGSSADDTRAAVASIVRKVTEGGPSEPGLRVL